MVAVPSVETGEEYFLPLFRYRDRCCHAVSIQGCFSRSFTETVEEAEVDNTPGRVIFLRDDEHGG